ncbi:hypothetical protein [Clostridium drakei]|nr:hypothetical protein [Clostridium drakei]
MKVEKIIKTQQQDMHKKLKQQIVIRIQGKVKKNTFPFLIF